MSELSSLPLNYPSTIWLTGAFTGAWDTIPHGSVDFSDYTNYLNTSSARLLEQFQDFRLLEVRSLIKFTADDASVSFSAFSEAEIPIQSYVAGMPGKLILTSSYLVKQRLSQRWVSKSFDDLSFWPVPVVISPTPVYWYAYTNSALSSSPVVNFNILVQVRGISSWNSGPTFKKLFGSQEAFDSYLKVKSLQSSSKDD
jgi:hypothetical protein